MAHSICRGKDSWPELVGKNGDKAAAIIERENRHVHAIVVKEGSPVTGDFRCDRVRVFIDENRVVVSAPTIT